MTTGILSDYLEAKLIDHTLRNTAYTTPGTSVWLALHTANPADTGAGAECTFANYVRVQVTDWNSPVAGATANTNQIIFATAGVGANEVVTHVGIWDNDGTPAGNLLYYGALTSPKTIVEGVTFKIAAGDLDITIGGDIAAYLANKWLDHTLRNTAFTTPGTSVYVALYNTGPAEVSTSGTAYERVQVTAWDAPGATDGATENTNQVTFPTPTASWGELTHSAILDSGTEGAGNLLFGPFAFSAPLYTPTTGDEVAYAAGALDVTVS